MTIYSCKGCEKRYPGCHGRCEAYLSEKAKHDALKAENDRKKAIVGGVLSQRSEGVYKATKHRRKGL